MSSEDHPPLLDVKNFRPQILGYFGDKFLGLECTLEAETSVSNTTQYKIFIGDDKKIRFLEWPSPLS